MHKKFAFAAALLLGGAVAVSADGNVKRIRWNQDDAQRYMTTKIYPLKFMKAADLAPFVEGAIKRYNSDSAIQRLTGPDAKQEMLVVSTAREMIPYVDDMIAKLDRTGGTPDQLGSGIVGTGIARYAFFPKYRTNQDMLEIIKNNILPGDGAAYYDPVGAMIYFKSSEAKAQQIIKWINALDRPVPQVSITVKVYEVRDSTLRDLGIDYAAWKNGPGLDMFGAGYDLLKSRGLEQIMDFASSKGFDMFTNASFGYGGIFFAPQFDASFVRVLEQSGAAKSATSSSLTVVNDIDGSYSLKFTPDLQAIVKGENDQTSVTSGALTSYELTVNNPVICFRGDKMALSKTPDGYLYYEDQPKPGIGTLMPIGGVVLSISTPVERNNVGEQLTETTTMNSSLTIDLGVERLLGSWKKTTEVKEEIGVPFLSDIPYLKYLFSTETSIKSTSYIFVTVQAEWINPDSKLAGWGGKLFSDAKLTEFGKEETTEKTADAKAAVDKADNAAVDQAVGK